ncbi:MAG: chemotaxis protein CheW [Acidobacteriaceae bacterium]|nr:chemotaxis protein CheW [Acidobacteriaceae bacterium]
MEDEDIIREFLIESNENLNQLDQEIVDLEQRPTPERLASIFRTFHTIKGTCGFLGFQLLERIAHHAENILSQLRSGVRPVTPSLVSSILESTDAVRKVMAVIEATGSEGTETHEALISKLKYLEENTKEKDVPPASLPEPVPMAVAEVPADVDRNGGVADSSIRVDVVLLDKLMNLVGELVLARNQILQYCSQREDSVLNAASQRLNLITSELQENVMKTRMQPIGVVWNKLPRVVRDMATSLEKNIRLHLDGAGTELDKTIIETIKDPLMHLVRNSCDHGIETPEIRVRNGKPPAGTLTLRAYHEGGQVNIEIIDDGAGIDVERVKRKAVEKGLIRSEQAIQMTDREAFGLIFAPGFSTAAQITNVSGRGVGMDVVKSNVEKIGGAVDAISHAGAGTTVKLKIPLTLAIIPGLVITTGGQRFVIPQVSLLELVRLEGDTSGKIEWVHGTPVYRRRGALLPIADLNDVLKLKRAPVSEVHNIVVLQAEDRQFGLVVDEINDTEEIVVKPLGKQLKGLAVYAGATIMGDGQVALILDIFGLGRLSGVLAKNCDRLHADAREPARNLQENQRLLIFRAGSFRRIAVPLSLVARLEKFSKTQIESASGKYVLQYRDRILPVIFLEAVLKNQEPNFDGVPESVQVIVFSNGERSIGIAVEEILDVIEDSVAIRRQAAQPGFLGSAVIGHKVTDFLDLHTVVKAAGEDLFDSHEKCHSATVLLAEPSPFNRALLRNQLEMAGHRVLEAAGSDEIQQRLQSDAVDVLVTTAELSPAAKTGLYAIPSLILTESIVERNSDKDEQRSDCQLRFDRNAMLRSIEYLSHSLHGNEPVEVKHR